MKLTETLALAVTATLFAGGAQAEELIIASGFPPSHTYIADGIMPWQECVTQATNGDLTFQNFPSGQISGHEDGTHALETGIAHVFGIPPAYESAKFPLNTIAQLPGIAASAVEVTAAYHTMLNNGSPLADEWTAVDAKPFLSMQSAPYQLLSVGDPIDSMDKFSGLKVRSAAGPMTFAVEALGATPVDMSAGDMYVGLQRGTVDATVLAMTSASAYKLDEVVKSVSTNGSFAFAHTVWAIDQDVFDGLSATNQAAIMDCGLKVQIESAALLDENDKKVLGEYAAAGVTLYEFSPEVLEQMETALGTVAEQFVTDLEGRGLPAREAYEMFVEAVGQSM